MRKKRLLTQREDMTLPDERYRAVDSAYRLLMDLCDPSITPRVPKTIRLKAAAALRHYPSSWDLDQIEHHAPHIIQRRMEPLYKMIKQHEMAQSVAEDYAAEGLIKKALKTD